ncbi:MAG: TolC family protein [bacterium]|nr:TolC family protein [bacterium]
MKRVRTTACLIMAGALFLMAGTMAIAGEAPAKAAAISLTLQESIDLALKNNVSLKAETQKVDIAADRLEQARSQQKFTVGAGVSASHFEPNPFPVNNTSYDLGLQLDQPLYNGGRLKAQETQAEIALEQANVDLETRKDELILSVKRAFYGLAKAQRLEVVAREAVDQARAHLDVTQKFYKAGTVAKYDVLRAQTQLAQVQQNLVTASNGVRLSMNSLNNLLGIDLSTTVQLKLSPEVKPVKRSLNELISLAWEQRPELRSLALSARINEVGRTIVISAVRPNVSGTLGYSILHQDMSATSSGNLTVGISANLSLFDNGLTKARLSENSNTAEQLKLSADDARRNISLQVRQSYLQLQQDKELIEASRQALEQAEEGNRIAAVRYQSGVSTSVELIDAQTALTQARINYSNAVSDYEIALSELERAVSTEL